MTQQELEERTGLTLTTEEFNYVHSVYMNIPINFERGMDKGELASILIGKSRAYSDGDFRQMAIKLIGERGVVLQTIEMGLPLWEEDIEHIKRNLSNGIQKRIR